MSKYVLQTQQMDFLANLWKQLTEPSKAVESYEGRNQARTVAVLLLVLIPLAIFTILRTWLSGMPDVQATILPSTLTIIILFAAYAFSRTRYYLRGAFILIIAPMAIISLSYLTPANTAAPTNLFYMTLSIVLGGLLLSTRGTLVVSVLTILTMVALTLTGAQVNVEYNIGVIIFSVMAAGLLFASAMIRERYVGEINRQLQDRKRAEEETAKRAAELETVARVSAAAATNLNMDTLLQEMVDLTKHNFHLYHAHVYLLDETTKKLVLAAGAGKAGKQMKEKGHSIPFDKLNSLVAQAARARRGVIANNVTMNPDFLPNPLLPDTKSEMAIPMVVGSKLVGVLDVQSDAFNRFTNAEVQVQTTLASQLAVAIENARAFENVQKARQEVERLYESSIDMIGTAGFDGYFKTLNPAWTNALGWTVAELTTRPYLEFVHADDMARTQQDADDQIVAGRKTISFENRYLCKDGSYRWLSWNATPDVQTGLIYFVTRDVTEQKRIQDTIRQGEERYRSLTTATAQIVWSTDAQGLVIEDLPYWREYTGQTFEETKGWGWLAAVHPDDQANSGRVWQEALTNKSLYEVEQRIRRHDGVYRDFAARGVPIFDADGSIREWIGTCTDITESKKAAAEIKRSEELIRSIINTIPDWIWMKDREYRMTLANTALATQGFGMASEEIVGKTDYELGVPTYIIEGDSERGIRGWRTDDVEVVEHEQTIYNPNDVVIRHNDGAERIFETSKLPLRDAENNIIGVMGYARDITERKHQEAEIAKRAVELEAVAVVSAATTTILDVEELLQSVSDLTKVSFELYHAHVYLLDERGENLVLAAGAGDAGRLMKERQHSIPLSREDSLVALCARKRDGVIVNDVTENPAFLPNSLLPDTRSELAVPMIVGSELIGVMDFQSDQLGHFTEDDVRIKNALADQIAVAVKNVRAFEYQRSVADRLREVDRLKSEFLANMSHELRTPLNSIIGYSEVLLDGIDGDLSDDAVEDVRAIHGSGQHLLNIINDILDLAKIEAGQMRVDPRPLELNTFIKEITHTAQILVKGKPVELNIVEESNAPIVYADPIRLRQIVWNLVNNAIKFTEQGSITVHIGANHDRQAVIRIVDTGIGMKKEDLPLLFEQFRQVDGSSTRRAGGTGLGLHITRHLVRMHGGDIHVESEFGIGSTFSFTLPLYVAEMVKS